MFLKLEATPKLPAKRKSATTIAIAEEIIVLVSKYQQDY